ncbi:hypothetical protein ACW5F0_02810 [Luteimonas sp. A534]
MARRQSDPAPWGFSATAWQALAFVLLGLLALTNAAWFYNVRVARAEAAAVTPAAAPIRTERVIYQTPDGQELAGPSAYPTPTPAAPVQRRPTDQAKPLSGDEKCIGGTRFGVSGSTWTQNGTC